MLYLKYLVLLCFLFHLSFAEENKEKGLQYRCDYIYDSDTKAFYKYHRIPSNWQNARAICFAEDAILASPKSPEIKDVMKQAASINEIHTGFHSIHTVGNYYSIDGHQLHVPMTAWVKGEPDNKNDTERCLAMNKEGLFYDTQCSQPMPFVCMRSNTEVKYGPCGLAENGYILYERVWKCYKFHLVPRNYSRASFICAAEGGHLVVVNDTKEATVVRDLFREYKHEQFADPNVNKDIAFIGFHNFGEKNEYRTVHGQPIWEYYNDWQGGHPKGDHCGGISRDWIKLWDLPCDKPHVFICEKPMNYPPVCNLPEGDVAKLKTRVWVNDSPEPIPVKLRGKNRPTVLKKKRKNSMKNIYSNKNDKN